MPKRKKKADEAPGRRPCLGCGESVAASARFCEYCGQRLEEARGEATTPAPAHVPAPETDATAWAEEFDARESQKLARDLYEAHARLLKDYRKRVKKLSQDVDGCEQTLGGLASAAVTQARTDSIQSVLETLETCGDRWEELQLDYNRASEELDEEYTDRCAEIEVDIELPDELQTAMSREMKVTAGAFDRLGERIHTLGNEGNGLLGGASGRWFGDARSEGGAGVVLLWGLAILASALALHFVEAASPRTIGVAVAAPTLVFILALTSRRSRA